ncbi:hypothetical protein JTE90_025674 [Oedothorax gibbosus]|uniref:Uncharacterized protein n=1 Tax=Oedothorax gibbosus TaxID=931172 RepID=A0AAV6UBY9_9ARAC|nr:hypothetical protein JTE90_025674 [Oedothorax gibbosus]
MSFYTVGKMNSKCLMLVFVLASFVIAAAGARDFKKRHAVAKRQTDSNSLFGFDFSFGNIFNLFINSITFVIKTALKVVVNSALTALPVIG